MVATAAAGYLAAPLVGTVVAGLVSLGQATRVMWIGAAILLTMLVLVRNAYGALSLVLTAVALLAVSLLTPPALHAAIGGGLSCFLLFAGPRTLVELHRQRRNQFIQSPHLRDLRVQSDVDQLARLTGLSVGIWLTDHHGHRDGRRDRAQRRRPAGQRDTLTCCFSLRRKTGGPARCGTGSTASGRPSRGASRPYGR